MKYFLTIIVVLFAQCVIGQPKAKNDKKFSRTDTGFIYYWSQEGYAPSIAFVRNPHPIMTYKDFSTKNISYGYAVSYDGLHLDLVYMTKKYGGEYRLVQYDSLTLKICPIAINYTVDLYEMSKKELRESQVLQKFKLPDKSVKIRVYDGILINIHSLTPIEGYH